MNHCSNCGQKLDGTTYFCTKCGVRIDGQNAPNGQNPPPGYNQQNPNQYENPGYNQQPPNYGYNPYNSPQYTNYDLMGLPPYYHEEFAKINASGETYKGKFNFAAFFFGIFWCLYRGLYIHALILLIASIVTVGVVGFILCCVLGARGNWILYNQKYKGNKSFVI